MSDQFFIDEDEPQTAAGGPARAKERAKVPSSAGGIKPPTFGMAVAIALVSLVLGLALGYFVGMYVASNSSAVQSGASAHTQSAGATNVSGDTALPSNHPDLTQFTNPDGTVNQEALDQYLAERGQE